MSSLHGRECGAGGLGSLGTNMLVRVRLCAWVRVGYGDLRESFESRYVSIFLGGGFRNYNKVDLHQSEKRES